MQTPPGSPISDGPRVLLVEDDGITARYVLNCLRSAGYPPPIAVASAEDALVAASTQPPDLVLMDVALRGEMDGVEAAGRIREHTGAQVLFVTACGDEPTRRRALAAGASGFLVKPFLQRELCAAVGRALGASHAFGPPPSPSTAPPVVHGAYEQLSALAEELERQNEALARSERRVEEERRRYRVLSDLVRDGHVITDAMGIIRDANPGAGGLLGMDPAELVGKPLSVFVPQAGHQAYYEHLDRLAGDGGLLRWEALLRPQGRDPFPASLAALPVPDASGGPATLHWILRDVSALDAAERALHEARKALEIRIREHAAELARLNAALEDEARGRRNAEEALRETRQLFQSVADAAPNMLYAYDLRGHRSIYANTRLATFLGHSPGESVGVALDATKELIHPEDHASADAHLERLLRAPEGEVVESTFRLRHDGDWRWVRFRDTVSARDATGRPLFCVGSAEDVTEQLATQAALANAGRLADAGRLAASFAHEINNPLQGVLGCLSLLEEALTEGHEATRYIEVAQSEVRRAVRVVGRLRDLSHETGSPIEGIPTDLAAIITQVVAVVEKRSRDQGVRVDWPEPGILPPVVANPDAIEQVFLNLVLNALDAMPDGGSLRIAAEAAADPEGVRVTFTDDGPGIDPDLVPRLFGSFVTTKPDGLGLGLYISRSIVEQHGGRIELDTELGTGTTFSVWLPTRAQAPQHSCEADSHVC